MNANQNFDEEFNREIAYARVIEKVHKMFGMIMGVCILIFPIYVVREVLRFLAAR